MAGNAPEKVNALNNIIDANKPDLNNLSLEALVLLINTERLKHLHEKTHKEFSELKKRQDQVAELHGILKKINEHTNNTGDFDCSKDTPANTELKSLLKRAKELGADVQDGKFVYNKEERDRLVENLRMTVEDLNVMNDMQLQTVNRLTNERYESYQLARSILKPLHDAKMQSARAMAGR